MNLTDPQDGLSKANVSEASSVNLQELQYHFEGLRDLFLYALIALIALTVTFDLFFLSKQMVFARTQLNDQRPRVTRAMADFKRDTEPLVKSFTASLQSFGATNKNFQPILDKYRLVLGRYMQGAAVTSAQPALPTQPGAAK